MFQFKTNHSFEQRKSEAERIRLKYPDRIPVIVEKIPQNPMPDIDKHKFLVPGDLTVGQFVYVIRKRLKLPPEKAIFIFVDNRLPLISELMSSLHKNYKDADGFVYISYSGESTFG